MDAAERAGRFAAEEVPGGCIRHPAEVPVEGAVEEEGLAEVSGDGEDQLAVGDHGKHLLDHPLGPGQSALLATGGAKASSAAGVGEDPLGLPGKVGIATKEPHEPEVRVPAAEKIFQDGTDTPVEGSMGVPEPFIPDL